MGHSWGLGNCVLYKANLWDTRGVGMNKQRIKNERSDFVFTVCVIFTLHKRFFVIWREQYYPSHTLVITLLHDPLRTFAEHPSDRFFHYASRLGDQASVTPSAPSRPKCHQRVCFGLTNTARRRSMNYHSTRNLPRGYEICAHQTTSLIYYFMGRQELEREQELVAY